ncbi:PH domain-containing protein [Staphylococcus schleiferi subsp. coagulans]|uniref:PH domain-containing protein n=1 Tax=Staphylococcus coagulans TaxID=74706 RepID=A0A9X0TPC8_9STAP|nr:PH domain-containing protein [Staphylococcus coagulans]MBA8777366.1 PH domain-containing protein [Staphylococcus coagulans]
MKEPKKTISKKAITYWRILDSIIYLFFIFVFTSLLFLNVYFSWPSFILKIFLFLFLFSFVWFIFEIVFRPKIKQKYWRYDIDEECIQIKTGGFLFKKIRVIPLNKVYYIDKTENFILNRYKLTNIKIGTLTNIHEIPAIPQKEASKLHQSLNNSVKKYNFSGALKNE